MTHPQIFSKNGITITLFPFLTDKLDYPESIPTARTKLQQFTSNIENKYPGIRFDYTYMNSFKYPNLWFIEILANELVSEDLINKMYQNNQRADSIDTAHMLNVMKKHFMSFNRIEGLDGVYNRV